MTDSKIVKKFILSKIFAFKSIRIVSILIMAFLGFILGGEIYQEYQVDKEIQSVQKEIGINKKSNYELSRLLECYKDDKDRSKQRISAEECNLLIEKFDILNTEDGERLEKLAVYLNGEIKAYLDNHEYEDAKTYTLFLEVAYYQLKDENKIYEAKKRYGEIKREYFMYKLTHPFSDPLEVFSAIIFEVLLFSVYVIKKIKEEKILSSRFILKYWHSLILFFLLLFIVLWTIFSIFLTILK